jgi:hypothetical protein
MHWLKSIAQELLSLFVDDGRFAIAIIAWLGVVWILSIHILERMPWSGFILFAGLALILIESTRRQARR